LLLVAGTVCAAANLRDYGFYWAQTLCANTAGLCDHSYGLAIVLFCAIGALVVRQEIAT
jgi:hypothetical protein